MPTAYAVNAPPKMSNPIHGKVAPGHQPSPPSSASSTTPAMTRTRQGLDG